MLDYEALKNAMADLDEELLNEILESVMKDGGSEAKLAMEACQDGMSEVGKRFEEGEYFVGDLIFAGELLTVGMETIKPALAKESGEKLGSVLLCTVKDDLHDIGKNIVKAMLEAAGFTVVDLGIDVPAEKVVATVKEQDLKIVALSGVLTLAVDSMKATVDALVAAGLRDEIKVIIGGNPVNEQVCQTVGADEWAHSPQKTVEVCRGWAIA